MNEQDLAPQEEAALESILSQYRPFFVGDQGIAYISQLIVNASGSFHKNPLIPVQKILDKLSMPVKFVALPMKGEILADGEIDTIIGTLPFDIRDYYAWLPHSGDYNYDYRLWIIINRPEEYESLLEKLHVTPEENLLRLQDTGVLVPKEGTDLSKASNAGLN